MNGMKQADTPKTPSAPAGAQGAGAAVEQKELDVKKLTAALITALEHKLGRRPTAEELAGALQDSGDAEADAEAEQTAQQEQMPKILQYRIHYGLKANPDGTKAPDPDTPLFYSDHEDKRWFDVDQGMWLDMKPPLADHLHSRVLGDSDSQKDVFDAIVYGVLDDEDYSMLSQQQGMLDPRCIRAYELHKKARDQFEQLQAMEKSIVQEVQVSPDEAVAKPSNIDAMMSAAGLETSKPQHQEPVVEPGANGAQVMSEQALAAGIEPRVRKWIAEEIEKAVPQIVQYMVELFGSDGPEEPAEQQVHDNATPQGASAHAERQDDLARADNEMEPPIA